MKGMQSMSINQNQVLDRLKLSQRMIEQRENKLRTNIDGKKTLMADDGDHGVVHGHFSKRNKGNNLTAQLSYLIDSPSKANINNSRNSMDFNNMENS